MTSEARNKNPVEPWDGQLVLDLDWLRTRGALAGVAEVVRERRRQIEQLGYTVAHDDTEHGDGWLMGAANDRLADMLIDVGTGVAGYPECEQALRQAGALAAAEIDRLNRMLAAEEPRA